MDKREAIRRFIRRNSSIFRMSPFPEKAFKKLKHEFFIDFAKIGAPRDSEIAGEIIESLIKSAQIETEEDLTENLKFPFFKRRIHNKPYYYEKLRLRTQQEKPFLDISKLEEAEYVEKVREEMKKEAKEEVIQSRDAQIQELEKKIEAKKDEYLSIPSILDSADYPIPDMPEEDELADEDVAYLPWWSKLGLKDDPFYSLEGLSRISREMYDQIVHKTEIFNKYEQMIERSPKELFKNTVVYGQFGSGKTTFFDYINPKLYRQRIYPIYVQLGGEFEVRELIFEFRRKMNARLSRLVTVITGQNPQSLQALDDKQAIIGLLKKLADHEAKGFVVFIDDLHKGELEKALRFMSYLQVLTSGIVRETPNLNIGFFVAGSLEWERNMAHDLKFEGSIAREERMPILRPEVALDALNKRFQAFAENQDNPRQIDRLFLEKIYKKLQYSGQDITFRKVIREIINEFEAGHFDSLSVDPIKIPVSTLDQIKSRFEKNLVMKRRFDQLIYGQRHLKASQKKHCLELLVYVYLQNGLVESDIREADMPFLQRLHKAGLITKVLSGASLTWKIPQDLWYLNKQIIQHSNLSFEDYLPKIYYTEPREQARKRKVMEHGPEIEYIDVLLSSMKQDVIRGLLSEVRTLHIDIIETGDKYLNHEENSLDIVQKCIKSLAKLTKAYQIYEKLPVEVEKPYIDILQTWKDFWWSPEIIQQFVRANDEIHDMRRAAPHIISLYREAFSKIFGFFKEEYEKSRQFHIPLSNLRNNEIELLHSCRELWSESQYPEFAGKLAGYVEGRLRSFLFNIFTILYGDFEHRKAMLDNDSRKYVDANIRREQSKGFPIPRNEFKQLNRGQYRNLMTGANGSPGGRRNWNCIFSSIYRQWSEIDLDNYLEMFAEVNMKVAHKKDDILDQSQQDYVYSFMQKSMRFLMNINQTYDRLLTSDCIMLKDQSCAYMSLNGFKDTTTLTPIRLKTKDAEVFQEIALAHDKLKILLDDQEYVEGMIGLSYRKAYALLALLLTQSEEQIKKTRFEVRIFKKKACEIFASFQSRKCLD